MTLIATVFALVIPPQAEVHENPCDRHCRAEKRAARAEARRERRWRRTIEPYLGWLSSVRWCESGGNYSIATGNGYYGAYQFTLTSWYAVGGQGYPHQAPALEQDYRAVRLLWVQGTGAWPVCG